MAKGDVLCVSVRLESMYQISDKAFKARDFNGNEDIIPASQVFGIDYDVVKSEAWWISKWILEKKSITYSGKKTAWFSPDSRTKRQSITVTRHTPEDVKPVEQNEIDSLAK